MNPRPLGYEPSELPNCSTPRRMRQSSTRPQGLGLGLGDALGVGDGVAPLSLAASCVALIPALFSFW